MYPVNQVFLGSDPMMNSLDDLDMQIQKMEAYRQRLKQLKNQPQIQQRLIWDEIDAEITPLTDEQRALLMKNEEYYDNHNKLQSMVQAELINLVKGRIEATEEGRKILESQLKLVKKLKGSIIDSTNREMEMFRRFKETSKQNPNMTYDEFIQLNLKGNGSK